MSDPITHRAFAISSPITKRVGAERSKTMTTEVSKSQLRSKGFQSGTIFQTRCQQIGNLDLEKLTQIFSIQITFMTDPHQKTISSPFFLESGWRTINMSKYDYHSPDILSLLDNS